MRVRVRKSTSLLLALLSLSVLLLQPGRASAYVGPGAGLELVGYFFSLMGVVAVAFTSLLLWPVYSLVRWIRGTKPLGSDTAVQAPQERSDEPSPTAP
jgi:hypothetical protein